MTTDALVVAHERLPKPVAVGDHFDLRVRAVVRKIEAELIDVVGFNAAGDGMAFLNGEVTVELVIEHITAEHVT